MAKQIQLHVIYHTTAPQMAMNRRGWEP